VPDLSINPDHDNELDTQLPSEAERSSTTVLPPAQPTTPLPHLATFSLDRLVNQTGGEMPSALYVSEGEVDGAGSGTHTINVTASQEGTRAKIALYFTYFFLSAIALALVMPFVAALVMPPGTVPDPIETSKNMVALVSSVLAGPFGFIVGFYFKQSSMEY
jgi:hypothetical protein